MKQKTLFVCSECGAQYPKWQGQCTTCKQWNTIAEETVFVENGKKSGTMLDGVLIPKVEKPILLQEIMSDEEVRIDLQDSELNRVLGGGLVNGSFLLLGGEPGIGKSTLILQTVLKLQHLTTLYVSGEESRSQLKMRADRIGTTQSLCHIYCETSLEKIIATAHELNPDLVVIDSIQTIYTERSESSAGSVSQIRECANLLLQFAKSHNVPVILIGHINKEGTIAGPKVLEHTVDVVLQFDGDKHYLYRILRAQKNRFGSTAELGIYEMQASGLQVVENPSEHLINRKRDALSGIAIAAAMEGVRPFLIEVQALVGSAVYNNPQRSATGYDLRRMNMLLAVLEKRAGFKLIQKDVFLNIAGGVRINDPASDLAVISSVLSSNLDIAISPQLCMTGEVGLSGEVRAVSRIEQRIMEAHRVGFTSIIIPEANFKSSDAARYPIRIIPVSRVEEAFRILFTSSNSSN